MDLETLGKIASIFQSFAVGVGALLAGVGALTVLDTWYRKRRYNVQKKKWLRLYPKDKLGKDFRLLRHSYSKDSHKGVVILGSSGNIYVCDKRTLKRHWVVNFETLTILGFNKDEAEGVSKKELERYVIADHIDLTPVVAENPVQK